MTIEKKLPSKIPDLLGVTNQKFTTQLAIVNLHPNEYTHGLHYYPFSVNLGRWAGNCNTLNGLSKKLCVPNKGKDLNISLFNMITGINELKTLSRHISCEFKCKFDGIKCNSN